MYQVNTASRNSPTLSGIIMMSALAATSTAHSHNNYYNPTKSDEHIIMKKSAQTFSSVTETKSDSIDVMLVKVFDRMSKNTKTLDDDFARILSENILDLF
jgi:hypothetical protein|tara:strand:+ start:713 stop:1012 length:300 start_codon:yes stop_codon:yes gene_type:complete